MLVLCNHFGVSGFLSGSLLICLCVHLLQVPDVHLELPLDLVAVVLPGIIALHLITPDIWVNAK